MSMLNYDYMSKSCTLIQRTIKEILPEKIYDNMWFRVDITYGNIVISYKNKDIWAYDRFSVPDENTCATIGYTIARSIKYIENII